MHLKSYFLTVYLLLITVSINAQVEHKQAKKFNTEELQEDLTFLNNYLKKGHPGLYWYSTEAEFTEALDKIEQALKPQMTELDFLREVAKLNRLIKCAHSDIRPSVDYDKFWRDSISLIPFNIQKVVNGYIVCQNLSDRKELNQGAKIISINDYSIDDIVSHLLPYIPADGNNQTRKFNALSRGFYHYYSYYFNSNSQDFKVVYEDKSGNESTLSLTGITKATFDKKRKSLKDAQSKNLPIEFVVLDSISTGILTIRSFRNDLMEKEGIAYNNYINKCFKQLASLKSENLIIDLRGNGGGYSEYAAVLFSYLTDTKFKFCKKQILTTNKIIDKVAYDIPETFDNFPQAAVFKDDQYQWTQHSVLGWRDPSNLNFKGNVYFLIDGGCSSTTSEFASLARGANIGTFIGQEVGGCYMGNTGGVLGWFELPNTKLRVRIGMVKFEMTDGKTLNKQGVMPDISVEYTMEDIIQEKNLELDRALIKIMEQRSSVDNKK